MSTVTTLKDQVDYEVMEPRLSGDSISYSPKAIKTFLYRCNGCARIWNIRWHAQECEKRGHVASFDQVYRYRAEGFQTTGRYGENRYTRYSLGRDKRLTATNLDPRTDERVTS